MKHSKLVKLAFVSTLFCGMQSSALAENIRVKAGLGYSSYSSPNTGGTEMKFSYSALNLGASYFFSDWGVFADVGSRLTLGSPKWNTSEITGGLVADSPADRKELTLTVGKILGSYNVFGGYQYNLTTLDFGTAPINATVSGIFLGGGANYPIGPGSLSVTAAYAMMGATMSQTGFADTTYDPDSGYSFGASYSFPFSRQIGLVGAVKQQSYKPKNWGNGDTNTSFDLNVIVNL